MSTETLIGATVDETSSTPDTDEQAADRIWCPDCSAFTARLVRVDVYGDEILHCRVCKLTWIHP